MGKTRQGAGVAQADPRPCFMITVDTEGDNPWARPKIPTTLNSKFLPRFQALCEFYHLRPTYLVNYEMAKCPYFQEFGRDVLKRGTGEIGMHLHAWHSPPDVSLTADDTQSQPYLIEYSESVMRDKIALMTDLLEGTFEIKVTSHRAGRWGFNSTYARILAERGYLVDSSVTPHVSWGMYLGDPTQKGGPDYSDFPELPYFVDLRNISQPGNSRLLEIPVTSMDVRPPVVRSIANRLAPGKLPRRAINRFARPLCWLNPIGNNDVRDTLRVVRRAAAEGRPCMQAFHSPELMPQGSPRFPKKEDVEALYDDLNQVFSVAREKFRGVTATDFWREFSMRNSIQ